MVAAPWITFYVIAAWADSAVTSSNYKIMTLGRCKRANQPAPFFKRNRVLRHGNKQSRAERSYDCIPEVHPNIDLGGGLAPEALRRIPGLLPEGGEVPGGEKVLQVRDGRERVSGQADVERLLRLVDETIERWID
jgi:hypothetical protein